ncbi:hypothetical protein ACFSS9_20390 [Paenibacillus septentrionalis]|uniref:hypothetical protein n=1 Tax=Paenibacillus septentrionalis TaxID=429342 RepID=UPI0036280FAF
MRFVTLQADALKQWLTATGNPSEASVEVTIAPVTSSELANASAKGGLRVWKWQARSMISRLS